MTHLMRRIGLALVALGLVAGAAERARAGSITYHIIDYPSLQNGYTLSGTITTDGAIGTLARSDITAWSYTATNGTDTYSATYTDASAGLAVQNLTATTTSLSLAQTGFENFLTLGIVPGSVFIDELEWARFGLFDSYNLFSAGSPVWDREASNPPGLQLGGTTWIIATTSVPEPGTISLMFLGSLCLAVVQCTRR